MLLLFTQNQIDTYTNQIRSEIYQEIDNEEQLKKTTEYKLNITFKTFQDTNHSATLKLYGLVQKDSLLFHCESIEDSHGEFHPIRNIKSYRVV